MMHKFVELSEVLYLMCGSVQMIFGDANTLKLKGVMKYQNIKRLFPKHKRIFFQNFRQYLYSNVYRKL